MIISPSSNSDFCLPRTLSSSLHSAETSSLRLKTPCCCCTDARIQTSTATFFGEYSQDIDLQTCGFIYIFTLFHNVIPAILEFCAIYKLVGNFRHAHVPSLSWKISWLFGMGDMGVETTHQPFSMLLHVITSMTVLHLTSLDITWPCLESLLEDFKHALVWGSSVKQSPQAGRESDGARGVVECMSSMGHTSNPKWQI